MKTQLALIALLTMAGLTMFFQENQVSSEESELFQKYVQWKGQYNKFQNKGDDQYRFFVWSENYKFVQQHNAESTDLKLDTNQFADLTIEEFKAQMLTRKSAERSGNVAERTYASTPDSIDWRSKGNVAPIQNQGQCGSCWAFSAVATLTSLHSIKEGSLVEFSEQQLVSCDKLSMGCNGGNEYTAMKYYSKNNGLETSESYPYEQLSNGKTTPCNYDSSKTVWKNSGAQEVAANSPDAMKEALAKNPISIAINGASIYFQLYSSGVLSNRNCGTNLDHAVNIVGYNASSSEATPYWIVRNSWGASWGEQGYAKFAIIDGAGICGSQMEPCYAI